MAVASWLIGSEGENIRALAFSPFLRCPHVRCDSPSRYRTQNIDVSHAKAIVFVNPATGEQSNIGGAGLWTLLFGCFYFAHKGNWTHAFISGVLAIGTAGISWLFYHFFAEKFMRSYYLSKGWRPVG